MGAFDPGRFLWCRCCHRNDASGCCEDDDAVWNAETICASFSDVDLSGQRRQRSLCWYDASCDASRCHVCCLLHDVRILEDDAETGKVTQRISLLSTYPRGNVCSEREVGDSLLHPKIFEKKRTKIWKRQLLIE